jgi:nucleotide-binding universal stress UspA family protein
MSWIARIVQYETEREMYKKILVPLDGSKIAEGVLPHAKALAYSEGAEIILLNVASNPAQSFAFEDPAIAGATVEQEQEQAGKYMEGICNQLRASGFKVTYLIREGGAGSMILKTSEDLGVDAIAMSTHGLGSLVVLASIWSPRFDIRCSRLAPFSHGIQENIGKC